MSNFHPSHFFCGIGITKLGRKNCTLKVEWRWRNPYKYVSHFISLLAGSSFSYQLDRENNCRADPNSFARTKTYQHFLGLGKVLLLTVLGSDVEKQHSPLAQLKNHFYFLINQFQLIIFLYSDCIGKAVALDVWFYWFEQGRLGKRHKKKMFILPL